MKMKYFGLGNTLAWFRSLVGPPDWPLLPSHFYDDPPPPKVMEIQGNVQARVRKKPKEKTLSSS